MYATSNTTNSAVIFAQAAVSTSNPAFVAQHLSNFKVEASSHRNWSIDKDFGCKFLLFTSIMITEIPPA